MMYFAVSSLVSKLRISSYSFNMEVVTHNKFVPSNKLSQTLRYGLLDDTLCMRQFVSRTILSMHSYFFNKACRS